MEYNIESPLLSKSGFSAGQLQAAVVAIKPNHGFNDFQAFVDAENQFNFNSLFILAHAIIESAWGTSNYAVQRNNLFGFNAVDSDPDLASSYSSQAVSIHDYADFMNSHYLYAGEEYWGGEATPHGIFVHYSSSHDQEAEEVVGIMNELLAKITNSPAPTPQPTPTPAPSGTTYTVKQGDNMSNIAAAHGLTLAQLEQMNPNAGHPAGNYGNIWPGDVLTVGGTSPTPVQQPQYYTVKSGDNMSEIASAHGLSLGQLEALNPNAGHPAGNYGNIWPGDVLRVK